MRWLVAFAVAATVSAQPAPRYVVSTVAGAGPATDIEAPVHSVFASGPVLHPNGSLYVLWDSSPALVTPEHTVRRVMKGLTGVAAFAFDAAGNLYGAYPPDHLVFKLTPEGAINTIAGTGQEGSSGDGGPATQAQLRAPSAIAVDKDGTLYIADPKDHRVRKIGPDGIISTVLDLNSDPEVRDYSYVPSSVALDAAGDLYVGGLYQVLVVPPGGPPRVFPNAGLENAFGFLAFDPQGNLYISRGQTLAKFTPGGAITVIAGGGSFDPVPNRRALDVRAASGPIAADRAGNVYFGSDGAVWRLQPDGLLDLAAGYYRFYPVVPALGAGLNFPTGVALGPNGTVYIADRFNNQVHKLTADGILDPDGGLRSSSPILSHPTGVAVDAAGGLYTALRLLNRVQLPKDYAPAALDLSGPSSVAVDASGNLFIADFFHYRIRKLAVSGAISTFAGTGQPGYSGDNGPAVSAQISGAWGIALDSAGNLYIADTGNHRIRKVSITGVITTVAGTGDSGFAGDGGPAALALLDSPYGIAVDRDGNLFIADRLNNRIRKVDAAGVINTVIGRGTPGYAGDGGLALDAELDGPWSVAAAPDGTLYVSDTNNHRIRKCVPVR